MRLKNKVAVVTGSNGGIGAGICRHFLEEGANVVGCDIRKGDVQDILPDKDAATDSLLLLSADVTRREELVDVAAAAAERFGGIDIWVNCAGISHIIPFLECSEELWDRTIEINLKGTFNGCQAALPHLINQGSGVILNLSSQSGKRGNSHYAAYCASKFGIIGLTQSLAVEFAAAGIRVNALCPGVVFTPLWDDMIKDYAEKRNLEVDEVKPYLEKKIPLGRLGTVEDVANVAVFLASDEAAYMTGQSVNITGGGIMS